MAESPLLKLSPHQPDWATGQCSADMRPWPCEVHQVLLRALYCGAPDTLREHLDMVAADAPAAYREQIVSWLTPTSKSRE